MKEILKNGLDLYLRVVLPPGASDAQRRDMEKAFYAGASTLFDVLMRVSEKDIPDDNGAAVLSLVHDELTRHVAKIKAEAQAEPKSNRPKPEWKGPMSVTTTTHNQPGVFMPMEFTGYSVASWRPSADDSAPCEQVHFILELKDVPPIVMRLKSPRAANELIGQLCEHRDTVWPERPSIERPR
jgi:hypothetical protein